MTVSELVPILFLGVPNSGSTITAKIVGHDYIIKRKDRAYIDDMTLAGIGDCVVDCVKAAAPMHYIICIKTVPVRKGAAA